MRALFSGFGAKRLRRERSFDRQNPPFLPCLRGGESEEGKGEDDGEGVVAWSSTDGRDGDDDDNSPSASLLQYLKDPDGRRRHGTDTERAETSRNVVGILKGGGRPPLGCQ